MTSKGKGRKRDVVESRKNWHNFIIFASPPLYPKESQKPHKKTCHYTYTSNTFTRTLASLLLAGNHHALLYFNHDTKNIYR